MDSGDAGKDSDTDRWIELGNLGLEKSLLKAGVSPQWKISRITTFLREPTGEPTGEIQNLNEFLGVKDGVCILLATLGRDSENSIGSTIDNVENLEIRENFVKINTAHFTKLAVGQRELSALWVNLARNPKITKLSINFDVLTWVGDSEQTAIIARPHRALQGSKEYKNEQTDGIKLALVVLVPVKAESRGHDDEQNQPLEFFGIPGSLDLVVDMVTTTTTLRDLTVCWTSNVPDHSKAQGGDFVEKLANALRVNTSLESFESERLDVSPHSPPSYWAHTFLAVFTQEEEGSHDRRYRHNSANCTITRLSILGGLSGASSSAVGTLCSVLRTNKTLKAVNLRRCDFRQQEAARKIVDSLRSNDTLERLDLSHSEGLTEDVFDTLMNFVQFTNTRLNSIRLLGTGLQQKEGIINEELRVNRVYRTRLASEDKITPTTGRIVLCGFPFAGKTSICKALQKQDSRVAGWKSLLQKHPRFRQLLYGTGVHQELHNRTRGLDVTFRGKPPDTTAIWDFGGQQEYYVLHDYLFPNAGNSCFLYVCSARHPPNDDGHRAVKKETDIREEFRFWMRFIASNFKHLKDREGRTHRPSVTFVITHLDSLHDGERRRFKGFVEATVADFRAKFGTFLDISDTAKFIDARFPEHVENLFAESKCHLKKILDESQEYKVCSAVRDALQVQLIKHPSRYIFNLKQVREICARGYLRRQLQVLGGRGTVGQNNLNDHFQAGLNIVLKYLNDVGDIIFVEGLNFIIARVTWFGREVLGHLMDPFEESRAKVGTGILGCLSSREKRAPDHEDNWLPHDENGFVRRSSLDRFLKVSLRQISSNDANLSGSLIDLMVHLELCFEELPGNEGTSSSDPRYLFPALLDGTGNQLHVTASTGLQWTLQLSPNERNSVCYVGRRLECSDECTFLTPGFFPRLQVVLVNYFRKNNWLSTRHFSVSRNILRFAHDGMEIIVEYSSIDYFVDVLVKSTKEFGRTLEFIGDHVLRKFLEFCSSPQGCQGVDLVEAVIRPACVKNLSPCEERRNQSVRVSYLKSQEPGYVHTWAEQIPGASDCDSVFDLLLGPFTPISFGGGILNKIQKSSEVPTKFYFTIEDVGAIRKVDGSLNTGKVIPIKLHILCDGADKDEPHQIDGQRGRVLHMPEDSKSLNLPILWFASHMLFEGTRLAAGLFSVQTPRLLERFFENLHRTAVLDIDHNTLKDLANIKGESSPGDILEMLKKYASVCPESEWWKEFLNLQNFSDFFRDFELRQWRNRATGEASWLCKKCYKELWLTCYL